MLQRASAAAHAACCRHTCCCCMHVPAGNAPARLPCIAAESMSPTAGSLRHQRSNSLGDRSEGEAAMAAARARGQASLPAHRLGSGQGMAVDRRPWHALPAAASLHAAWCFAASQAELRPGARPIALWAGRMGPTAGRCPAHP